MGNLTNVLGYFFPYCFARMIAGSTVPQLDTKIAINVPNKCNWLACEITTYM